MTRCTWATGIRGQTGNLRRLRRCLCHHREPLFPDALLHWEDFGADNARRILERYRDQVLTFNDDMQGTGAMNLAAVLSAVKASGTPLVEQRIVVLGAGTAGTGIADQLRDALIADGLTRDEADRAILGSGPVRPAHRRHDRPA